MKQIHINVGPSGSGKTMFIRNMLAGNPFTVLSRDKIREEVTGDMNDHSKEGFVTKLIERRFVDLLLSDAPGSNIIAIDNTNLKSKDRNVWYKLIAGTKEIVDFEYEIHLWFFEPNLDRINKYQATRTRQVPNDAIAAQIERYCGPTDWEKENCEYSFVNPEHIRYKERHAIIGDIHGEYEPAEQLLEWLGFWSENGEWKSSRAYKVISLGDLNDCKKKLPEGKASSVRVIETFMELTKNGWAEVLMSNHGNKLMRFLKGNKVVPSHGLSSTIDEFNVLSLDRRGEIYMWLCDRPYTYEFRSGSMRYVCAHAYVDNMMANKDPYDKFHRNFALYGLTAGSERVPWWNERNRWERFDKIYPIVGHYHLFMIHPAFAIIDSDEALVAYLPEEKEATILTVPKLQGEKDEEVDWSD